MCKIKLTGHLDTGHWTLDAVNVNTEDPKPSWFRPTNDDESPGVVVSECEVEAQGKLCTAVVSTGAVPRSRGAPRRGAGEDPASDSLQAPSSHLQTAVSDNLQVARTCDCDTVSATVTDQG